MLVGRQRGKQAATLRDEAHAQPRDLVRVLAHELLAMEADRAARRGQHAHDHLAERRFAHTVAADYRDRSLVDGERDILQDVSAPIEGVEVFDLEYLGAHCLYRLPM